MLSVLTYLALATFAAGEPIMDLKPLCPDSSDGIPELQVTVDVPAYALAKCKNGEKVLRSTNEVLHTLQATFLQNYNGSLCQFNKKNGSNTYVVQVEIGWGEKNGLVMRRREIHTVTCAYDDKGTAISSQTNLTHAYIAPRERQSLLGSRHPNAVFDLKVVDVLDHEVTSDPISLGKTVRLKVVETNSTTAYAVQCPVDFIPIGDACYHITHLSVSISFTSAEWICMSMDAELVAVETREEFDALKQYFISVDRDSVLLTSGMVTGQNTASWSSVNTPVQTDGYYWFPGFALAASPAECISLQYGSGEFGYRDTPCSELAGRGVLCECPKLGQEHVPPQILYSKVTGFRALSCAAKNSVTSYDILRAGCGDGLVFDKKSGFTTVGDTVYSPYFDAFRLREEDAVQFQCNFTICEGNCDGDSCSVERLKRQSSDTGIDQETVFTVTSQFLTYAKPAKKEGPLPTAVGDLSPTNIIQYKHSKPDSHGSDRVDIAISVVFFVLTFLSLVSFLCSLYVYFRYDTIRSSSVAEDTGI